MKNRLGALTAIRRILIVALLLVVLFVSGLGISCQSQGPAPPVTDPELPDAPPSGEPPSPPSESWSADGVIGRTEYLGEMNYNNHEIFWSNDQQYVYIALKAKTAGWVAVGIQPGSRMKDADMIMGFVRDGEVTVLDLFSTGDFGPHPADTELGGTFDIIDFGGKEAEGYTIIEFKRALDTGDQYDNKLSIGQNLIIWAYGSADVSDRKHASRGYGEIIIKG